MRLACGLMALSLLLPSSVPALITDLDVSPQEPTCLDFITAHVEGVFDDGCWDVSEVALSQHGIALRFSVVAADGWEPDGPACPEDPVPYAATEFISLLPGSYVLEAVELATSLRQSGDSLATPFDVLPHPALSPVSGLQVEVVGEELRLRWDASPETGDYIVFTDTLPGGSFDSIAGTTTAAGEVLVPIEGGTRFFLVSGRVGSCPGPKRGE